MSLAIHAEPRIAWHGPFSQKIKRGLNRIGVDCFVTADRVRQTDYAVLLGTTLWRGVEESGHYLLVDRASVGDPEYVQLVWDGHGRRGNHCVPDKPLQRFEIHTKPWRTGRKVVLCGQTETYSPEYPSLMYWYSRIDATHFRGHPAGDNPTGLPACRDWDDVATAITLNSSVGVDAVLNGIPTVTMDAGAMAWDVTSHDPSESITPNRTDWLAWLSWTQWSHDEIEAGEPIRHLFEVLR